MTASGPTIAVLDYGIGNLRSAEKALQRVGGRAELTANPKVAGAAAGVVLPGVGAFGPAARALRGSGLADVALGAVAAGRPFLGICIGLQLLFEGSEEDGGESGLGVLPGRVRRLPDGVKRPQMQWNVVEPDPSAAPLFAGLDDPIWMYFVHSYAPEESPATAARCDYGGPIVAAVAHGSVWGTQFHPEKSGTAGLRLLANFVAAVEASTTGAPAPGTTAAAAASTGRRRAEPSAARGGPSGPRSGT